MVPNRATHRICNWNERFENERSIEKCSRGIKCRHLVASTFDICTIFLNWPREEWLGIHFENSLVRNIGYLSRILFFIFHMTNQITFVFLLASRRDEVAGIRAKFPSKIPVRKLIFLFEIFWAINEYMRVC